MALRCHPDRWTGGHTRKPKLPSRGWGHAAHKELADLWQQQRLLEQALVEAAAEEAVWQMEERAAKAKADQLDREAKVAQEAA